MTDRTIVLDPANPIPFRVFDNGDGSYSLAIHDPNASVSGIQYVDVQLTSAQLLDLHNTPVELVPAPGEGLLIVPESVLFWYHLAVTPFTVGSVSLQYGFIVGSPFTDWYIGTHGAAGLLDQAQDETYLQRPLFGINPTPWLDLPLSVWLSGAITDGDGTLSIRVWYSIVPAAPFGA